MLIGLACHCQFCRFNFGSQSLQFFTQRPILAENLGQLLVALSQCGFQCRKLVDGLPTRFLKEGS
jgi:hypothetical protein